MRLSKGLADTPYYFSIYSSEGVTGIARSHVPTVKLTSGHRINTTFPNLDCVFLNAGTQHPVALSKPAEVNLEAFHAEVNTNFTCIVDMTLKFLPHLQAKSYPTGLVVTGTHLALIPAAAIPAYSASKAALHSFLYCLRAQTEKAGSKTKIIEIWPPLVQCTSPLPPPSPHA